MPQSYQQMLRVGAAHHLTYRQLDHWTRLGLLHCVDQHPGSGRGRDREWLAGEDQIAATMARLVTAGLKDLAVAHRIARGDIHLAPGITIHIHDRDHRHPPGDGYDPFANDLFAMPDMPRHLTPAPLTDPALGPVAA